jgi:peptidoglycan/xylan/chitin deacetylase (PgdA/CDA1 family)
VATGQLGEARARSPLSLTGVPVLLYHGTIGARAPELEPREKKYWVPEARFCDQLDQIHRRGYRVLLLSELWSSPAAIRDRSPRVALTFDDGRESDYSVTFPALQRWRVGGDFFVNTSYVGKPGFLTWQQMAEMQRGGMRFQSHGHEHVDLSRLPEGPLRPQLDLSKRLLEDRLGAPVDFLGAPYGLVSPRLTEMARQVGYRAVCTSRNWPARPGSETVSRAAVYAHTSPAQFRGLLEGNVFSYGARMARTAVLTLPRRFLLRYRPERLGVRTLECHS